MQGALAAAQARDRARSHEDASSRPALWEGGTLVICPTTVLQQWVREIQSKVDPKEGLSLYVYHGPQRVREASVLASYEVVLTTYQILAMEAPKGVVADDSGTHNETAPGTSGARGAGAAAGGGNKGTGRRGGASGGPLFEVSWHRVVLDEAQSIKNPKTRVFHASCSLHADNRWCLTGTPIQNTLDDLLSYFRFLRFEPYCQPEQFRRLIKEPITTSPEVGFKRVQAILKGVLLRRTKTTM